LDSRGSPSEPFRHESAELLGKGWILCSDVGTKYSILTHNPYILLGDVKAEFVEQAFDRLGRSAFGQATEVNGREVAGERDAGNATAVFESNKRAGNGAAEIIYFITILICLHGA
jgi:hypothetical protein